MKRYELKINGRDYEVVIKKVTPHDVHVEVNGQEHVVEICSIKNLFSPVPAAAPENSTAQRTVPQPPPSPVNSLTGTGITAPMPGQIKGIFVREGDQVTAGQKLLIMEAMKLENKILARQAGIVQKIMVRDGDTVNQGQELILIE